MSPSHKCVCKHCTTNHEMSKTRNYCFTSYRDQHPNHDQCRYIIYQRERCPTTGREHWQGTIVFQHAIKWNSVGRRLGDPNAHIEPCQDLAASIRYCSKSDTRVDGPFEFGDKPAVGREKGWWTQKTELELWKEEPDWMLRHYSGVRAFQSLTTPPPKERPTPQVHVYIGPPGTGKSWTARQLGDYYIKPSGVWWDGYRGGEGRHIRRLLRY